jgi:hypothetical protein
VAAQNFTDALDFANMSKGTRARLLSWRWTRREYRALRFTALSDVRLVETQFHHAESQPQSWKNLAPGRSVSVDAPKGLTGADLLIWPGDQARENTEALAVSGLWEPISPSAVRAPHIIDLRRDATACIRRSGCHYILLPVSGNPVAKLRADMLLNARDWGIEPIGPHRRHVALSHPARSAVRCYSVLGATRGVAQTRVQRVVFITLMSENSGAAHGRPN